MKKVFLMLSFAIVLSAANSFAQCTPDDLVGEYRGDIMGGGVDSITAFEMKAGHFLGSYIMSDVPDTPGVFTSMKIKDNIFTAEWSDVYGNGTVRFLFSDDCNSFVGYWNGLYTWFGTKPSTKK